MPGDTIAARGRDAIAVDPLSLGASALPTARTARTILALVDRVGSRTRQGLDRYRGLVGQRNPALLLGAGIVSELGDWFNTLALISLAYRVGDGSLGVGLMLSLRMVPRLVFQAPAGSLVDRWPGRRLLAISHLAMAVLAAGFVLLVRFPAFWLLATLIVALETANTVAWPAFRVQLTRETGREHFAAINAMLSLGLTMTQFIGPVLGGLVLVWFGATTVFLVNSATFAAVTIAVLGLRGREVQSAAESSISEHISTETTDVRGYRWLLRRRELMLFAVAALGVNIAIRAAITLFVVRSLEFGLGEAGPGYFYAAVALGAVVGGAAAGIGVHATWSALATAAGAIIVCALALAGFGLTGGFGAAMLTLVVAGLATNVYEVLALTFFQHHLPAAVYGRFNSIFLIALSLGGISGALLGPLLLQVLSVGATLVTLSVPGVIAALLLVQTAVRHRNEQTRTGKA